MELFIEDLIYNKILEIKETDFESFPLLNEIIVLSKNFKSTLNNNQILLFNDIIDKIDYYEASKSREIVRLAIFLYKNF